MVFVIHDFSDLSKRTNSVIFHEATRFVSEEAFMLYVRLIHAQHAYQEHYDLLKLKLAKPAFNPCESAEFRDLLEAKDQVQQALQDLISIHPAKHVIKSYLAATEVFAFEQYEEQGAHGWSMWQPPYALQTQRIFDAWRASEVAYVALGYRSVALEDWMDSVNFSNVTKHLPRSVFPLLLRPLETSEKPVLHADKWLQHHPRLMFA